MSPESGKGLESAAPLGRDDFKCEIDENTVFHSKTSTHRAQRLSDLRQEGEALNPREVLTSCISYKGVGTPPALSTRREPEDRAPGDAPGCRPRAPALAGGGQGVAKAGAGGGVRGPAAGQHAADGRG